MHKKVQTPLALAIAILIVVVAMSFFTDSVSKQEVTGSAVDQRLEIMADLADYNYRVPIWVTEESGAALTSYSFYIDVDTATPIAAGKMNASCKDIRFSDSFRFDSASWANNYDYWIEEGCNMGSTRIWVEIDTLAANEEKLIFMYYGNDSDSAGSNGDNTFQYFDHWTADNTGNWKYAETLNNHPNRWENTKSFSTSRELRVKTTLASWTAGAWDYTFLGFTGDKTSSAWNIDSIVMEWNQKLGGAGVIPTRLRLRNEYGTTTATAYQNIAQPGAATNLYLTLGYESDNVTFKWLNWDTKAVLLSHAITDPIAIPEIADTPYLLVESLSCCPSDYFARIAPTTLQWGNPPGNGGMDWRTDYWFIRKYAPPDPTSNVLAEQNRSYPVHDFPVIVIPSGNNHTSENMTCYNISTYDDNDENVTNIYNWYLNGTPIMVGYWPFDSDDSGGINITKDYSGSENHGQLGAAADGDAAEPTWNATGKVGGAYTLDGDDYIRTAYEGGPSEYTVSLWFNLAEEINVSQFGGRYMSLVSKTGDEQANIDLWSVWFNGGTGLIFRNEHTADATYSTVVCTAPIFYKDTWYHIAVTGNTTDGKIYLDGALNNTASDNFVAGVWDDSVPFDIGRPYTGTAGRFLNGSIDEVRVYNRALSPAQIDQLYRDTKDGYSNNQTIVSSETTKRDTWTCTITPTDGQDDGLTRNDTVVIEADAVTLYSRLLPATPNATTDLIGYCNGTSISTIVNYSYAWYKDGVLNLTGDNDGSFNKKLEINLHNLSSSNLTLNDIWTFSCLAKIGDENATSWKNASVTIQSLPPTHTTPIVLSSPGAYYPADNLTCYNQSTADQDGDAVHNTYNWYLNGNPFMVLNLPFNYNTANSANETKDYSGYSNDGEAVGAIWNSSGKVGGTYQFDGTNDFISVPDSNQLDIDSNDLTLEAWIYPKDCTGTGDGRQTVVTKVAAYYFNLESATCKPSFYWYDLVAPGYHTANNGIPTGKWSHVVLTYDGVADIIRWYINGSLDRQINAVAGNGRENANPLVLGGYFSSSRNLDGFLDEVRVYDSVLSATQIYQRFAETKGGFSTNATIVSDETSLGQNWTCQVIPSDGWTEGTALNSSMITIVINNAPATISARISPTSPSALNNLEGYCNATDLDGDDVNYTYHWKKDGVLNLSGYESNSNTQGVEVNVYNLTASNTSIGDNWTLSCLAYDGNFNSSSWQNTSVIVGDGTPPTVTLESPADSSSQSTTSVTFSYNVVDLDSDIANCSVWINANGTWLLNATNSTTVLESTAGQQISLTGLPETTFQWNIQCYDTSNNAAFATNNYTLTIDTSSGGGATTPSPASTGGSVGGTDHIYEAIPGGNPVAYASVSRAYDKLLAGDRVDMDVEDIDIAVKNIEFGVNQNFQEVSISASSLSKPSEIRPPRRIVYQYLDISATKITGSAINSAAISFAVDKIWMRNYNIKEGTIRLERYVDSRWDPLTTVNTADTSDTLFFRSATPGFSYFAITGEAELVRGKDGTLPETLREVVEETQVFFGGGHLQEKTSSTSLWILLGIFFIILFVVVYRNRRYRKPVKSLTPEDIDGSGEQQMGGF